MKLLLDLKMITFERTEGQPSRAVQLGAKEMGQRNHISSLGILERVLWQIPCQNFTWPSQDCSVVEC